MGRKYEYKTGTQTFHGWGMERCEEQVFIAYWHEVKHRIPAVEGWGRVLEDHFYVHGNGIGLNYVDSMNRLRRRCDLDELEIHETDIYEYGRNPNRTWKAAQRRDMRDHYLALDTDGKQKWVERAMNETRLLPPPHLTFDAFKQTHVRLPPGMLSQRERDIRAKAILLQGTVAEPAPAPAKIIPPLSQKPAVPNDRIIRQLTLAQEIEDDDLIQQIVQQVNADDALDLAEELKDGKLRRALILHSLVRD